MSDASGDLLARIRDRMPHPASARELAQVLRIPRDQRVAFRRQLRRLAAEGVLVEVRGHRFGLPESMDLMVGRLETHRSGFGFIRPDVPESGQADVFVGADGLGGAVHGDRVVARIARIRGGRAEGRIVRILARRQATLVGRFDADPGGRGIVMPIDDRLLAGVVVARGDHAGASPGQIVVAEITRWPTATRGPAGRVVEVLGRSDEPGVDTAIVIRTHGLPDDHGPDAVAAARALTRGVAAPAAMPARPEDLAGRTDFRDQVVITIDGDRARDFDDAISLATLPNGHDWLGVHIADVAHYVPEGGVLDREARERGTSVYFPERALHMFPAPLATGLCSLHPGVDRLVQSCLMEIDRRGEVVRHEFHDGVVRCRARLTYVEVNAILTDRDPDAIARRGELVPLLESMRGLFERLNARRHRLGSIDFDLEQPEVVLDDAGAVETIVASGRGVAHRIIEEFMLLANQTVASVLEASGAPSLYRVHEPPDPLRVQRFEQFLGGLGLELGAAAGAPGPRRFQALLDRVRGRQEERAVASLMLRAMQKARYDPVNLGHFGLAFARYTHFTSPIRRYPDLVVHRLLRATRRGPIDAATRDRIASELPAIARHSSDTERRAEDAERDLVERKRARLMAGKIGEGFEGFVTAVTAFGLFVQLADPFVEGLVHVSAMGDDSYRYLEEAHALRGARSGRVYRLGDRVAVRVIAVDLERAHIGFALRETSGAAGRTGSRRASRPGPRTRALPAFRRRPGRGH